MLRNMKVRSKLAVILTVPICAVLLLGGWGVRDRQRQADQAADGSQFIELGAAAGGLQHELQKELLLSVGSLAQVVDLTEAELAEQRRATDSAVTGFLAEVTETEHLLPGGAAFTDSVRTALQDLQRNREQVDAGVGDAGNFGVFYGQVGSAIGDLTDQLTTAAATASPDVAGRLTSLSALTTAKSLFAEQAAILVRVFAVHDIGAGELNQLIVQSDGYDTQLSVFYATATQTDEDLLQDLLAGDESVAAQRTLHDVLAQNAGSLTGGAAIWAGSAAAQIDALRQVESRLAGSLVDSAHTAAAATARDVRLYGLVALLATVLALVLALLVARSLTRPLRRLTEAAHDLSRERLPALVQALHRPGDDDLTADLAPIPVDSRDEIGLLADAFNAVQSVTAQVADEQRTLLRKGIGDTFVTLARRNQSLIDRQITFLDELEANEQDPDTLEHLFQLDHLATRMRRNAESLLVLAGVEPARRRGQPVPLADAVRAAVGEVQDFNRVDLLVLDDATVDGNIAVDIAHLLAELMENATAFSPPDTRVEIVGHLTRDGYTLSVTDQGIGMSDAQLAEANRTLTNPPIVGLSLSRSLGFIVVSRLARRSGVSVRLTHSPAGGVAAVVAVPSGVLVDHEPGATAPEPGEELAGASWGEPASWSRAPMPEPEVEEVPLRASSPVPDWVAALPQPREDGDELPARQPARTIPSPAPAWPTASSPMPPPTPDAWEPAWTTPPAASVSWADAGTPPVPVSAASSAPDHDRPVPDVPMPTAAAAVPIAGAESPVTPLAAAEIADEAPSAADAAPITAQPEPAAAEPEPAAAEPEPAAPIVAEPEPAAAESEPATRAAEPEPATAEQPPEPRTDAPAPAPAPKAHPPIVPAIPPMPERPYQPAPEWVPIATAPASLSEAIPAGAAFDDGLAALIADGDATAAAAAPPPTSASQPEQAAHEPGQEAPPGAPALPSRRPGASRPGPESPSWATLPTRSPVARPVDSTPAGPATRSTSRSPEEVRAMLSNYRGGLSRGRTARRAERADRSDRERHDADAEGDRS